MLRLTIADSGALDPPQLSDSTPDVEVWLDHDGNPCAFGRSSGSDCWLYLPNVAHFCFNASAEAVLAVPEQGTRRELVIDAYHRTVVPLALQVCGIEVLHASAVRLPQGVLALCGLKETGKSTLAFGLAQRGYPLWADDAVALKVEANSAAALELPFSLRLRPRSVDYFGDASPPRTERTAPQPIQPRTALLAAVCVLERGSAFRGDECVAIERLNPIEGLTNVLTHAYCFSLRDVERKNRMMNNYLGLVSSVPVFRVCFRSGLENLPTILTSIEGAFAEVGTFK